MKYYNNMFADDSKPLVTEVGTCASASCGKKIYDNRLFVIDGEGFFHLSCFNELKKDDTDGQ